LNILEILRNFFSNLLEKWKGLETSKKILIGGTLGAVLITAIVLIAVSVTPTYRLLLSGVSEEEAGYIVQKLEEMNIPYKVEAGGRILIPDKYNVYEVRMKLASAGVLGATTKGFEILETQAWGATSFDKQVRYQIALQGELERSIMTIRGVRSARVHLVLPKYTYYVRGEMAEPRASVLLVLEPGVDLSKEQIKGIMELVAGAVEGLKLENVKVVDNLSRVLSDRVISEGAAALASTRIELKFQLEDYYKKKLKKTLENVFGMGRVEVIPDVRLNWKKIEKELKKYESPVKRGGLVRSQEVETEKSTNVPAVGGPVGTESNIPPLTYPSITGAGTSTYERSKTITNYEINEILEKIVENHEGEISALSVSVIIDSSSTTLSGMKKPLSEWASLVSDLVEKGIKASTPESSLTVSVAFLPFDRTFELAYQQMIEEMKKKRKFTMFAIGVTLLGILSFFIIYLMSLQIRRAKARKMAEERRKKLEEELRKALEEEEKELTPEEKRFAELKEELERIYGRSPEEVAEIVKLWFYERGT